MIRETKHCLKHLAHFDGRDARQTFWFYVLALVLLQFLFGIVVAVPLMASMFGAAFEGAQNGATPDQMNAMMMGSVADGMRSTMLASLALQVLTTLLFIAAFVRRLHDAGYSGYIAAIPVLAQAAAAFLAFDTIGQLETAIAGMTDLVEIQRIQNEISAQPLNYVGWIGYAVVIGFGVLSSQPAANRYGEVPTAP